MSVALAKISESVSGLSRAVANAQSSTKSISSTIKRSNTFKRSSMRISQSTFLKRREAVRRREQESIIEASSLSGAERRSGNVASGSTKGFMGRIMDFIGSLLVAWAIKNIPIIINVVKQVIDRINRTMRVLSEFVTNTGNFLLGFGNVLAAILSNISTFDFFDSQGKVSTAVDEMRNSFDLMEGNIRSAFDILSEPLDFSPLEGVFLEEGEEPGAEEPAAGEAPPTAGPPGPGGMTYVSQGGTKITDPGGADYGDYIPGGKGSRGKARVHGADGRARGHTGEDYAMPIGQPLSMIAKGTVVDVNTSIKAGGGYGRFVVVQLDNGMYVKMAHLDKVYVRKGQRVGAGSGPNGTAVVIGTSGNTGLSSGPHLHLDYAKSYNPATAGVSQTMNPKGFIEGGGLVIGSKVRATGQTTTSSGQSQPPSTQRSTTSSGSGTSTGGGLAPIHRQALDKISQYESASSGGYNAMNQGTVPDKKGQQPRSGHSMTIIGKNLTDMTLQEVLAHQSKALSNDQGFIHAAGRYQFIGKTLPGVIKRSNLPLSTKFSPDIQDRFAVQLMIEAGGPGPWLADKRTGLLRDAAGMDLIRRAAKTPLGKVSSAQTSSSISLPNLQAPKGNNTINVPMPAQQQASGGGSGGGGIMDTLSNAGQALNRLITQRFLTNL